MLIKTSQRAKWHPVFVRPNQKIFLYLWNDVIKTGRKPSYLRSWNKLNIIKWNDMITDNSTSCRSIVFHLTNHCRACLESFKLSEGNPKAQLLKPKTTDVWCGEVVATWEIKRFLTYILFIAKLNNSVQYVSMLLNGKAQLSWGCFIFWAVSSLTKALDFKLHFVMVA